MLTFMSTVSFGFASFFYVIQNNETSSIAQLHTTLSGEGLSIFSNKSLDLQKREKNNKTIWEVLEKSQLRNFHMTLVQRLLENMTKGMLLLFYFR